MKQKVVLILSVVIGLLAAFLSRQFLSAKEKQYEKELADLQSQYKTVRVMALKESMPGGTILKREDLKWRRFAQSALREQTILVDEEETIANLLPGKKLAVSVEKDKPLLWSDIVGGDPHARGLADSLHAKYRAISINVSGAASVSGMVQPNDRVDVLGTFSFPSKDNPAELELVTMTVLQNVTILATGRSMNRQSYGSRAGAAYSTVTLEVTPHEAEMLVFAEQIKGRLTLALRNPVDISYEKNLPKVNFEYIQTQVEELNRQRQEDRPRSLGN